MNFSNLDPKKVAIIGGIAVVILALLAFLFLRGGNGGSGPQTNLGSFGTAPDISGGAGGSGGQGGGDTTSLPVNTASSTLAQVFKIADGPVVAATLVESGRPTTTVARYVSGQDGHVLEISLDVAGAAPKVISNTTIPGLQRGFWTDKGNGVIVQYLDSGVVKSAHLALAAVSTSSSPRPAVIRFLPDGILALAVSPDGSRIAYLLPSAAGADGYLAKSDGSAAKKLFSLPLSQLMLSWTAPSTLLIYQKSAVGVPGIAFSASVTTGAVGPILSGNGLAGIMSPDGKYLFYQTNDGSGGASYVEELSGGSSASIPFFPLADAFPEQCVAGAATSTLYCAAHQGTTLPDYADLWHRGEASVADALVSIDLASDSMTPLALPGISGGGELSDIIDIAAAPGGTYLSFIAKDDASLWGVRLR